MNTAVVADLSTFSSPPAQEALFVAPPEKWRTPLQGPVPGRLTQGALDAAANFVLRVPENCNGTLVISAAPGLLSERADDLYWSDLALSRGCAFASTDKGAAMSAADGYTVFPSGETSGIEHWYGRYRRLAEMASEKLASRQVYAVGLSNGGYLARLAAERDPGLFDGALEVSAPLWRADGPSLLHHLPRALREYGEDPSPLLKHYRETIWELALRYFIESLDPDYTGELADYHPSRIHDRIRAFENTGRLQIPLISVCGSWDPLLPAVLHAEGYRSLVQAAGCGKFHRLHTVARGSHADSDFALFPDTRPLLPAAREAFAELVDWVSESAAPKGLSGLK